MPDTAVSDKALEDMADAMVRLHAPGYATLIRQVAEERRMLAERLRRIEAFGCFHMPALANDARAVIEEALRTEQPRMVLVVEQSPPHQPIMPVLNQVAQEVASAENEWPPLNSADEAFAVLLEEVDELKAHVWTNQKRRDMAAMRQEAVQVAAMAVRLIRDICDGGRGRA